MAALPLLRVPVRAGAVSARYRADPAKSPELPRRKHGGRRARVRGRIRVGQDFSLLAAGVNLQRLATLKARAPG